MLFFTKNTPSSKINNGDEDECDHLCESRICAHSTITLTPHGTLGLVPVYR